VFKPRRATTSAFSLLELLVVLAVLAAGAAVVAAAMGRMGSGARQRAAVEGVLSGLGAARLEAMKSQTRVNVELAAGEDAGGIRLSFSEREWSWSNTGMAPAHGVFESADGEGGVRRDPVSRTVDEHQNSGKSCIARVAFDPAGRADRAAWLLAEDERAATTGGEGPGAKKAFTPVVGAAVGRTLWILRFDVVSGVPSAERVKQP
jgi:prepilin-type N-terminal cleavage/methylation domain-containing protein